MIFHIELRNDLKSMVGRWECRCDEVGISVGGDTYIRAMERFYLALQEKSRAILSISSADLQLIPNFQELTVGQKNE